MTENTLLVTILEGRYFYPPSNSLNVYFQCRFNNELLSTDPVLYSPTPVWDTELAWDLSSKLLHFLRSQRVSLKLLAYSIDSTTATRSSLGFIMLDLRSAVAFYTADSQIPSSTSSPSLEKWYPLINSKMTAGRRPEVKICFAVGNKGLNSDTVLSNSVVFHATQPKIPLRFEQHNNQRPEQYNHQIYMPQQKLQQLDNITQIPSQNIENRQQQNQNDPQSALHLQENISIEVPHSFETNQKPKFMPETLTSKLSVPLSFDSITNTFNLGTPQISIKPQTYTLKLTISFAEHLYLLGKNLPKDTGYYFQIKLLTKLIRTPSFSSLEQPALQWYPLVLQILSFSTIELVLLFAELETLVVGLCGETLGLLGVVVVPVTDLAVLDKNARLVTGNLVELACHVLDPSGAVIGDGGKSPNVGVSMVLDIESHTAKILEERTEVVLNADKKIEGPNTKILDGEPKVLSEHITLSSKIPVPVPTIVNSNPNKPEIHLQPPDLSTSFLSRTPSPRKKLSEFDSFVHQTVMPDIQWHQFRFSIDLRSVRAVKLSTRSSIFLRYTYSPFGPTPFQTHPSISIQSTTTSNQELYLPNSFCAYEFVMSPDRLKTYLEAVPLVVEVWASDNRGHQKNEKIGFASVQLAGMWKRPEKICDIEDSSKPIKMKTDDRWITAFNSSRSKIAEIRVVIALEDFGIVDEFVEDDLIQNLQTVSPTPKAKIYTRNSTQSKFKDDETSHSISPAIERKRRVSIHDTDEYKAALELELWKTNEQENFRRQLQIIETETIQRLENEFAKREETRQVTIQTRLESIKTLEQQMENLANELESRERQLEPAERKVTRLREDLEREHEKQVEETRDAARRLHDEYKHRMELERLRANEIDTARLRVIRERDDLDARFRALEEEFATWRRKELTSTPEALLRVEINEAKYENATLHKRIEALGLSNKDLKLKLKASLRSLKKLQHIMGAETQEKIEKDRRELEELKIRFSAKRELEAINEERVELNTVIRELECLRTKKASNEAVEKGVEDNAWTSFSRRGDRDKDDNIDLTVSAEINRLVNERDSLLQTGVYSREDGLIRELNSRIKDLISKRNIL
ncbi:hypothetical protein HK096_010687 [Nowakowskiella sp. JEL0078]|nr:hypothetical protein HK096_010687 [Nowakowskiella sp. JEL0078]